MCNPGYRTCIIAVHHVFLLQNLILSYLVPSKDYIITLKKLTALWTVQAFSDFFRFTGSVAIAACNSYRIQFLYLSGVGFFSQMKTKCYNKASSWDLPEPNRVRHPTPTDFQWELNN